MRERHRLRADAAARFQYACAGGIGRIGMQQVFQRARLVIQAFRLTIGVAVDVCHQFAGRTMDAAM